MFIQICRPTEKLPTGAVYSDAVGNLHFEFLPRIHVEKTILASRPGRHAHTPTGRPIFCAPAKLLAPLLRTITFRWKFENDPLDLNCSVDRPVSI
jgi:hypothetical protein